MFNASMKKFVQLAMALCLLFIANSCKTDDNDQAQPMIETIDSPDGITIIDHGNQGNGTDIYVSFQRSGNENEVRNYHLILAKTGSDLSYSEAAALQDDRMYVIEPTGDLIEQQVQNDFKDFEGDAIRNDQSYNAYILTTSNTENMIGSLSNSIRIELKDIPYYEVQTLSTYPGMEALSYHQGVIIMPAVGNRLLKVDVETGAYTVLDTNEGWPLGGGFDPYDGSYFGAMYGGGEVLKYDMDGNHVVFADELVGPIGIAVDQGRNVYITNFDGNFISKVTPEGKKTVFANNSLGLINGPDGLVIAEGSLYAINFYDSRILKISSEGEPSLFATLPGTGNGYITYADNFFYAPSYTERKVYRIDRNGRHEVLAGNGENFSKDGPASLASFKSPNGITTDGNIIFVGDDNKIRTIIKHE